MIARSAPAGAMSSTARSSVSASEREPSAIAPIWSRRLSRPVNARDVSRIHAVAIASAPPTPSTLNRTQYSVVAKL